MDLSFESMLYDNSLEKPTGMGPNTFPDAHVQYPGMNDLIEKLAIQYPVKQSRSTLVVDSGRKIVIRYNDKGLPSFSPVSENTAETLVCAIIKKTKESAGSRETVWYELYVNPMECKAHGTWNLKKEITSKANKYSTLEELNQEILRKYTEICRKNL